MKVQVRKCMFTGKLFDEQDTDKYILHLKKLRKIKQQERNYARIRAEFAAWLLAEKLKITDASQIAPWIMENQQYLMNAHNALCGGRDKFYETDTYTVLDITLAYTPAVSNSHSSPATGVTNWGRKPGIPTSYKGWVGTATGTLSRLKTHMGSYPYTSVFNLVGVHTGSGGGGNTGWSYGVNIFLDDWPGLQAGVDAMEQEEIMKKLSRNF